MKSYFVLFTMLISTLMLKAQDLALFEISLIKSKTDTVGFISLSDIYPLSGDPDSLAVPDLSEKEYEKDKHYEYIKLSSKYRKQFLCNTKISETDKVFIYSYSRNILISFPVSNLNVAACLNFYGADWPYSQTDYMIGFEINMKFLNGFGKYFENTLVFIGKESPFILNQLKPIVWKKTESGEFSSKELSSYDTSYTNKYVRGDAYKYERAGLQYFVQDWISLTYNEVMLKCLTVIDTKTKEIVCEKIFHSGESSSFASLNNQWTGKLFKNKPPVIFGFSWVSFGCPCITFLNQTEDRICIYCDNRH